METNTLGSRSLASLIRKHVRDNSYYVVYSQITPWYMRHCVPRQRVTRYLSTGDAETPPEGWLFLGDGWSRMAFLGPDGVVYKVSKNAKSHSGSAAMDCNRTESDRFKAKAEFVAALGYRLAASRLLWPSVIAMEYVPENGRLDWQEIERISNATDISDLHSTNVWRDENGVPTLIDYAG